LLESIIGKRRNEGSYLHKLDISKDVYKRKIRDHACVNSKHPSLLRGTGSSKREKNIPLPPSKGEKNIPLPPSKGEKSITNKGSSPEASPA